MIHESRLQELRFYSSIIKIILGIGFGSWLTAGIFISESHLEYFGFVWVVPLLMLWPLSDHITGLESSAKRFSDAVESGENIEIERKLLEYHIEKSLIKIITFR